MRDSFIILHSPFYGRYIIYTRPSSYSFHRVFQKPLQFIPDLSPECSLFLSALLNHNPDFRPTCAEALNMPFMKAIEKVPTTHPLLITPFRQQIMTDLYMDMIVHQFYLSKKKLALFRPQIDTITGFSLPKPLPQNYSEIVSPFFSNISSDDSFCRPIETIRVLLYFLSTHNYYGSVMSLLAGAVSHSSVLSPTLHPVDVYVAAILDIFYPSHLEAINQKCLL